MVPSKSIRTRKYYFRNWTQQGSGFRGRASIGIRRCHYTPKGYHKKTYEICKKYNVLYISDEVVTAFGRLGHWFSSEDVFDFTPDIITCAKGLTSGYIPMGATIISDSLIEDIKKVHIPMIFFSQMVLHIQDILLHLRQP